MRAPTPTSPAREIGLPRPPYARSAEDYALFVAVMTEAFDRIRAGEKAYGPFRPQTDGRDLFREAEEELLDAIAYCFFAILKLRAAGGSR